MKGIFKNPQPQSFTDWKALANEDWTPTFSIFRNPQKAEVRRSLLSEQGYICCYCCSRIEDNVKTTVMEHFIPQSEEDEEGVNIGSFHALDYDNLLACCDGTKTDNKSEEAIYCCDEHKKDLFRNREDPSIELIKPTERNEQGFICEQAFAYTSIGTIVAKQGIYEQNAQYSISILNLDNGELKRQREETCSFLFEDAEGGVLFDFSDVEVERLKQGYSQRDATGRFTPFCPIVLYFLSTYF
jgi:uncharacterized protein (TIGR02646 family)